METIAAHGIPLLGVAVAVWGFFKSRKFGYLAFLLYFAVALRQEVSRGTADAVPPEPGSSFFEIHVLHLDPLLVLVALFLLVCQERRTGPVAARSGSGSSA